WAREEPAGGGPVAALDAGLRLTTAEYAVVLSADLPFLGADTVHRLLAALRDGDADGAMLTDDDGRALLLICRESSAPVR
ncbi:NTP transferase domain-containing protein, partial [Streptomyces sp. SID1328]|nr:NTP transferase domain-containing protein [Streptomyces sp. SID1328]